MPTLLSARPPQDLAEERAVRKLATSRHAPGDWIARARMITRSWDGARTSQIAAELYCHPQTVRERIKRFNAEGLDGLGDCVDLAGGGLVGDVQGVPAAGIHRGGPGVPLEAELAGPLPGPARHDTRRRT